MSQSKLKIIYDANYPFSVSDGAVASYALDVIYSNATVITISQEILLNQFMLFYLENKVQELELYMIHKNKLIHLVTLDEYTTEPTGYLNTPLGFDFISFKLAFKIAFFV